MENTNEMTQKKDTIHKVVLAYSGGLDTTSYSSAWPTG